MKKKKSKFKTKIFICIIVVIASFFLYESYKSDDVKIKDNVLAIDESKKENNKEMQEEKNITEIIEDVSHTIVGISKIKNAGSTIFLKDGVSKMELGSGIIVSDDGYILTNEHVSGGRFSSCFVTIENGKSYTGNVIWSDSNLDLAIVKIGIKGLAYASLGDSSKIKVGETVYAIGNPIGYEFQRTVTSGIISAINRTVKIEEENKTSYMSDLIQTDATINPGNSGGALVNTKGEVIGINSVKITSAEGISFASPVNCVKKIIEKLKQNGEFQEAEIGIFAYDKDIISYIDSKNEYVSGIYVEQISEDSLAKKSELMVGDIITKIDEKNLEKMCDLREYIYEKSPGDEVNLEVIRNGKRMSIKVILGMK